MPDKLSPKYLKAVRKAAQQYVDDLDIPGTPLSILNASQAAFHQAIGPIDVIQLIDIAEAASVIANSSRHDTGNDGMTLDTPIRRIEFKYVEDKR